MAGELLLSAAERGSAGAAKRRARLRDQAEVVGRGALLPDGFIRCTTCHDARSQSKFKLSIPTVGASAQSFQDRKGSVDPTPPCVLCHKVGEA